MSNDQTIPADLLKAASSIPSGVQTEDYNPVESVPTLTVGKDFEKGMTVAGYYESTEAIASPKFTYAKDRNEAGVPVNYRHVLRIGSPSGKRLAIWTCGELRTAFEKLSPGSFIAITYNGKGKNDKGQDQHFFDMKRSVPGLN